MKNVYAVVGAGRQGIAAAYDLAKFGEAEKILLIDNDLKTLNSAKEKLELLTEEKIFIAEKGDVRKNEDIKNLLTGTSAIISCVPYYFNLELTKTAIELGANFCDLGGNTDVVKDQLSLNDRAEAKNISVVPDCGMDPGLNISFIENILHQFDEIVSIKSYGAGLPQNPIPPWNYLSSFHLNGLTNEYYGKALFLREGKIYDAACLEEREELFFPDPIGNLEAAVTSGGLSTLPFDLEGKINTLENKTLRYPGHWDQFKAYSMLGLFETEPVKIGDDEIIPRYFFHKLLEPNISAVKFEDIGIIKIFAEGIKNGKRLRYELELIERYDKATGFTAMQKLTGWHASIISILSANGEAVKGVVPVHKAVPGRKIIEEAKLRGFEIKESFTYAG